MDLITDREKEIYARLGIPLRFQEKGFNNYDITLETKKAHQTCKDYAHGFSQNRELGAGLILVGAPGTGKTHLAFSILRYVATKAGITEDCQINGDTFNQNQFESIKTKKPYTAVYTTVFDLFKRVRSTWGNGSQESEKTALAAYSSPDLLILDEVGMQNGTDSEKVIIFEVIDRRYQDMKPTIIVGNLNIKELTEYLGERIIDRMREGGGTAIVFGWDSYRKKDQ